MRDEQWWRRAACRTFDHPDWFFNMSGDPQGIKSRLQYLCSGCKVFDDCREYVDELEYLQPLRLCHGFWAGETVKERVARREATARRTVILLFGSTT